MRLPSLTPTRLTQLLCASALMLATPAFAQTLSLAPEDSSTSSQTQLSVDDGTSIPAGDLTDGSGAPSEPAGPPLASTEALKLFVNLCTEVAGGVPNARDDAASAGWTADDPTDSGPYVQIYSGYQELAGFGSVDVWS